MSSDLASQLVTEADEIAVNLPEATDYSDEELPILYLDDNVIVVNKPAGVLTHSKGALNDEFTVADFFRRYTTVGLETNLPSPIKEHDITKKAIENELIKRASASSDGSLWQGMTSAAMSRPNARRANAATTAESMPPDSPTAIPTAPTSAARSLSHLSINPATPAASRMYVKPQPSPRGQQSPDILL